MDDEESGRVGESIAYDFKLRMTEKSSQMDRWIAIKFFNDKYSTQDVKCDVDYCANCGVNEKDTCKW